MNTDKIISELATQYGIIINEKDPIIATVLINEIILKEYLNHFEKHLSESITNVSIKEDITVNKLRKIVEEKKAENRRELEKVLKQFSDNINGILHKNMNQMTIERNSNKIHYKYLIITFIIGIIIGCLVGGVFL